MVPARSDAPADPAGGFTLTELLMVIGIIGILVGLLFPAVVGLIRKAEQANTKSQLESIAQAIRTYHYETKRLPLPNDAHHGSTTRNNRWYHTTNDLVAIYRRLTDPTQNPAGRVYLEVPLDDDRIIRDAWGNPFVMAMNTDYSGTIIPWPLVTSDTGSGDYGGSYSMRTPVVVRSLGPNGVADHYGHPSSDDLLSFK